MQNDDYGFDKYLDEPFKADPLEYLISYPNGGYGTNSFTRPTGWNPTPEQADEMLAEMNKVHEINGTGIRLSRIQT